MRKTKIEFKSTSLVAIVLATLLAFGCSLKKPPQKVPADAVSRDVGLSAAGLPKTFFRDENGNAKRFLCGWAPITEVSYFSRHALVHNAPLTDHCNIEFEISEDGETLVGKMVNPSVPNDKNLWLVAVTIPITKHYYYEKEKDAQGRDTNRMIENDQRSEPLARPYMKLNLKGFQVHLRDINLQHYGGMPNVYAIEDVEWDIKNGFLGFTAAYADKIFGHIESQARFRVNFKEFKSNPNFVKTPFNDRNYKFLNVLHIVGKTINGNQSILHAAHWDLKKTHKVYLVGFPKQFESIGQSVVEDWNQALEKIGAIQPGQKPFVIDTSIKPKFSFDLRYITITWIDDKRISMSSPLGIAINNADLMTGEMLWGGITIYAGIIEDYIRKTMPKSAPSAKKKIGNLQEFFDETTKGVPQVIPSSQILAVSQMSGQLSNSGGASSVSPEFIKYVQSQLLKRNSEDFKEIITRQNEGYFALPREMGSRAIQFAIDTIGGIQAFFSSSSYRMRVLEQFHLLRQNGSTQMNPSNVTKEMRGAIDSKDFHEQALGSSAQMQCAERSFEDVAAAWGDGVSRFNLDYNEALKSIITALVTHEFGHFMGLGHQFKENILPNKGQVPDLIFTQLKDKAAKNFSNFTSVMGYQHPEIEMQIPAGDFKPAIQDLMALRYLYKREFPVYREGEANFEFLPIPGSGVLPAHDPQRPEWKIAYLPQCNDFEASYSMDPLCNRFDVGYDPETVMKGYFRDLDNSVISSLISFSDLNNSSPDEIEDNLRFRTLNSFSRIRLFYDYMRYRYKDEFNKFLKNPQALFEFNELCQPTDDVILDTNRSSIAKILKDNPGLYKLCRANVYALQRMERIISLKSSDYTQLNLDNAYLPGGILGGDASRDFSRFAGTWDEMASAPLKFAALFALSSPKPWITRSVWWSQHPAIMFTPQYDNENHGYSYSSVFPKDYVRTYSEGIKNNLFFSGAIGGQSENTTMGASVFASYFFNHLSQESNDEKRLDSNYNELIRSQSQFDLHMVAIILKAVKGKNNAKKTFKFTGTVYDLASGKATPTNEVYVLPEGKVIAQAERMFIFSAPKESLRFFSDDEAYVLAYRITYSKILNDPISGISIKTELQKEADRVLKACTNGKVGAEENGLATFFNEPLIQKPNSFEGFDITEGIANSPVYQKAFLQSVQNGFDKYYGLGDYAKMPSIYKHRPDPRTCSEATRALGLVVSAAAALNGYWIPDGGSYLNN